MVRLWLGYGYLWLGYGQAMVIYGQAMVRISVYGQVMVRLWLGYGQLMGSLWLAYGQDFGIWLGYGQLMVSIWLFVAQPTYYGAYTMHHPDITGRKPCNLHYTPGFVHGFSYGYLMVILSVYGYLMVIPWLALVRHVKELLEILDELHGTCKELEEDKEIAKLWRELKQLADGLSYGYPMVIYGYLMVKLPPEHLASLPSFTQPSCGYKLVVSNPRAQHSKAIAVYFK